MDITYLLFLQNLRTVTRGIFDSAFLYITTLGEDLTLMIWVCGIYWCVDKAAGIYLMFNFHIANFANQLIKITACVYRPWIRDGRVAPLEAAKGAATGYSFPSGHTAKAVGVWGGLAERMNVFKPLRIFLWGLVLTVGFSRNYLGVHTPQDVLVSVGIGVIFLKVMEKLLVWVEEKEKRDVTVCVIGIGLAIALLIYGRLKSYPIDIVDGKLLVDPVSMINGSIRGAGGAIGLLLGWLWERRGIKFKEMGDSVEEKLFCFLIGIAGLLIIMKVIPNVVVKIFPGQIGTFFNGLLVPLYIIGVYPWCVKHLKAN